MQSGDSLKRSCRRGRTRLRNVAVAVCVAVTAADYRAADQLIFKVFGARRRRTWEVYIRRRIMARQVVVYLRENPSLSLTSHPLPPRVGAGSRLRNIMKYQHSPLQDRTDRVLKPPLPARRGGHSSSYLTDNPRPAGRSQVTLSQARIIILPG